MRFKQFIAAVIVIGTLIIIGIAFLTMNREDTLKGNESDMIQIDEYETLVEKAEKTLPEIGDSTEDVEKMMGEPSDWRKDGNNVTYSYYNHKGVYYKFFFRHDALYHIKTGKGW